MPNFRILAPNVIGAATLTCSPAENAAYPVANVAHHRRMPEVLRTSGLSAQEIRATWAANQTIQGVAITRHNLTTAATWRVQLYSDAALTTLIGGFDSGNVTAFDGTGMTVHENTYEQSFRGHKNSVVWFSSAATTVRGMRITLTDAGNTDGYIEVRSVLAGSVFEPPGTENFEFGHALKLLADVDQKRTRGGTLLAVANTATVDRSWAFDLRLMRQSTRDWLYDLARTHGKSTPFFISMYPADTVRRLERDYQMQAMFSDLGGFERPSASGFGNTLEVAEA